MIRPSLGHPASVGHVDSKARSWGTRTQHPYMGRPGTKLLAQCVSVRVGLDPRENRMRESQGLFGHVDKELTPCESVV